MAEYLNRYKKLPESMLSNQFSVLLSVYYKEKPEHIRQCFDSIYRQTLLPVEVILVKDGLLTPELERVIEELQTEHANLKVIAYDENKGLGYALNIGLQCCKQSIVVRMDTDDICFPNRFYQQITFLETHKDVHVLSSWIDEFVNDTNDIRSTRMVPEENDAIIRFAKQRNPINHSAVVFRKKAIESVGGYQPFYLFEDYYLWVRLLIAGYKFHNLQQSLLYFRQSEDMFDRRGGSKYLFSEIRFQYIMYKMGFINLFRLIINVTIRAIMRLIPNKWRRIIYLNILRKPKS